MLPRVTFSTLACPAWSVETVIANARAMGYDGIEWRGGDAGHIQPAASRSQRTALREQMRDANLRSLAVTSYTTFVPDDPSERAANVDELKRYLELASDLDAGFVRVFLGELEPNRTVMEMYPRIVEALQAAVPEALSAGVGIAIEPHDDFVLTSAIAPILAQLPAAAVGAIWDIANAYSAGEGADEGAQQLAQRISYVQVKDGVGQYARWQLCNVGEGDVPLRRAMELLAASGYEGAFSVEWEAAWHPELEPPERALPHALAVTRRLLQEAYARGVRVG